MNRVCVIGAGCSGLASCQVLHARGVPFDCFEAGSQTGGNWRYHNDNGMSSAYRSLRAKSSSRCMQYGTFPMPDDYPDYPGHELIARYLDDFVEHFGFRERIQFRTEVTEVRQAAGAGWDVTVRHRDTGTLRTQQYGAVLVANGHHWDPRYPEPVLPGADTFAGEQIHSHGYHTPEPFAGKRVVVVGIGNSGCDVAAECAEVAGRTVLSVRRGVHVVPQYLCGRPTDYLTQWRLGTRAPLAMQSAAVAAMVRLSQGSLTKYGLPKPDHQVHRGPPTLSDSLPGKLASGAITVRPAIERFRGESVCFTDGTVEQADVVIYCTGYKISFPFLDSSLVGADDECVALYHRVIPPSLPGLYLIGLVQPIGAIMPLAEIQSEWVADLLQGRATLPPRDEMEREIASYRAATANRYARASRHDIQVDFLRYVREISRERRVSASCGWRSRTSRYKARPSDPETCDATGADAKDRSVMTEPRVLLSGLGIPESPRWHDGRLWFCNWIDRQVMAVDMDGKAEVMVCRDPASHPMGYSIDWLPDGRLLTTGDKVRRQEPDGSMAVHAEQRANEIVVDVRGNAYINGADFDFVGGAPPQPGYIKVITPDGQLRQVAGDIEFPNGMVITPDGRTLIISESFAGRLTAFDIDADGGLSGRRVFADGVAPDGICLDADGAVWTSAGMSAVVRVAEGGEVLQRVELRENRAPFALMLGGPDRRTLFICTAEWRPADGDHVVNLERLNTGPRTGEILTLPVEVPGSGRP